MRWLKIRRNYTSNRAIKNGKERKRKKNERRRKKISCLDIDSKCLGPSLSQDTGYYLLSPAKVVRKQKTENYSSVPRHNEQKRHRRWRVARHKGRGFARGSNLTICVYLGSWRPLNDTFTLFRFLFFPIFPLFFES